DRATCSIAVGVISKHRCIVERHDPISRVESRAFGRRAFDDRRDNALPLVKPRAKSERDMRLRLWWWMAGVSLLVSRGKPHLAGQIVDRDVESTEHAKADAPLNRRPSDQHAHPRRRARRHRQRIRMTQKASGP